MKIDVNDLEAQRIWVEVSSKVEARYGVHAVYSDEDGEIWSCSEEPVRAYRDIVPDFPADDELEIEMES